MKLADFENQVYAVALDSFMCSVPSVRRLTSTAINLRVEINTGDLVDAFYNEATGSTAYALIREGRRILGVDNTGGWHLHPFDNPSAHVPISRPMTFAEFIALAEADI